MQTFEQFMSGTTELLNENTNSELSNKVMNLLTGFKLRGSATNTIQFVGNNSNILYTLKYMRGDLRLDISTGGLMDGINSHKILIALETEIEHISDNYKKIKTLFEPV